MIIIIINLYNLFYIIYLYRINIYIYLNFQICLLSITAVVSLTVFFIKVGSILSFLSYEDLDRPNAAPNFL